MNRSFSKETIASALLIFLISGQVHGRPDGPVGPLEGIEAEYRVGQITLDEKAILQVMAITKPENLPERFLQKSGDADYRTGRLGTIALLDIRRSWESLSQSTRNSISRSLSRFSTDFTYDSPGGFFKLHYDTSGPNAVSPVDSDVNLIPDYIDKIAAYLDTSYDKHVALGYSLPPSDGTAGGDSLYDIYFVETGLYGYTVPEGVGPMPWNDYFSYIVMNRDFEDFPSNNDPEGNVAGAAKATAAHEYHHAVQMAYDAGEESWFMESDATWMEDIVYDHVDDNYNYLGSFFSFPHVELTQSGPHGYSSFIWQTFLAEKFDTSLMVAIWEGSTVSDVVTTQNDTLIARYGWDLDSAFAEFTAWNFATGIRDDGLHYEEGAFYPEVLIDNSHFGYPITLALSGHDPAGFASTYVSFFPGGSQGTMTLTFNGSDPQDWSGYVIKSTTINQHEFVKMDLAKAPITGSIEIPDFQDYYSVTLIGINQTEYSAATSFSYSATIQIPYSFTSNLLTPDSAVYSGGQRMFEVLVANTSPVQDVFSLVSWDDLGWITIDTINEVIPAGDSVVYEINVQPPQGTPLDLVSSLSYKMWPWGDTTVADTQLAGAKTYLFHGDTDFTGGIDIGDLTYFVAFLFGGGPPPAPVLLAGDFNCDGEVNVSDLTQLISFLFQVGNFPPCNPYQ